VHDGMLLTAKGVARSVFIEHSLMAWILGPGLESMNPKTDTLAWTPRSARNASYSWSFRRSVADLWNTWLLRASRPIASAAQRTSRYCPLLPCQRHQCLPLSLVSSSAPSSSASWIAILHFEIHGNCWVSCPHDHTLPLLLQQRTDVS
jgi:hypothetical protein